MRAAPAECFGLCPLHRAMSKESQTSIARMQSFWMSQSGLACLIALVGFWVCASSAVGLTQGRGAFRLSIIDTSTEHSRDTFSVVKTVSIENGSLIYSESGRRTKSIRKEYRLTDDELAKIRQLVEEMALPRTKSIRYGQATGPHRSVDISLKAKIGRRSSSLNLEGQEESASLVEDPTYAKLKHLLDEIGAIIISKEAAQ